MCEWRDVKFFVVNEETRNSIKQPPPLNRERKPPPAQSKSLLVNRLKDTLALAAFAAGRASRL